MRALLVALLLAGCSVSAAAPALDPGSCAYAIETERLANAELRALREQIDAAPDEPRPATEVIASKAFGVMALRQAVEEFINLHACRA